jgi:hypothetical protein
MPTPTNENITQNVIRAFTQRGGPSPVNQLRYAGMNEQYLMVGDISRPDRGGITAINVNDPLVRGLFRRTGVTIEAPDIPSGSITFRQLPGGVPWYRFRLNCPTNIYESEGLCGDPADPLNGWATLNILSQGLASDKTYAGRTPFDGSDVSTAEVAFSWMGDVYTVGGIAVGEVASVDVTTEVIDIVYGSKVECSNCGPPIEGTDWVYALQQTAGGSSADLGKVLYSVDAGATWASSAITGLGVGALVTAIDIVGQYLVVVVKGENAYYVSPINQLTGVPGTWTKVTSGFVASKTPNDLYVESSMRTYFVGDGGYVYVSTNILAGVSVLTAGGVTTQNLNRIHGNGPTVVAVGAGNTSIRSDDRGAHWRATTTSVTGSLSAVQVLSPLFYYVGTTTGGVDYTDDGGETWTALTMPGTAPAAVQDIIAPTPECVLIAATLTGPTAILYQTTFGGAIWGANNTSRLPGTLPVFARANRLAFPRVPDVMVAVDNLAVAGWAGNFTDGVIYLGGAPVY